MAASPALETIQYLDPNHEVVLTTKILPRYRASKDHRYHLILMTRPWVTVPVIGGEPKTDLALVDLTQQVKLVEAGLKSLHYDEEAPRWLVENGVCSNDEDEEDLWTSCDVVVEYIAHLWGYVNPGPYLSKITFTVSTWKLLSNMRGVFMVYAELEVESHAFIIWIEDATVHIYQGYGGLYQPIFFNADRASWFDLVLGVNSDPSLSPRSRYDRLYNDIFQVPPAHYFRSDRKYFISEEIGYQRIY